MKERKYFWCHNYCGRKPISELAITHKNASLCKTCYENGWRLRDSVEAYFKESKPNEQNPPEKRV